MMGRLTSDQGQLFYEFRLGDAVLEDHLVRKIDAALDPRPANAVPLIGAVPKIKAFPEFSIDGTNVIFADRSTPSLSGG